jgi:hypothetical protein
MKDPTYDELLEYLEQEFTPDMADEMDRECAIYWFASDYHSGQQSNLYSALSTSLYSPGPLERGPKWMAEILYEALETEFGELSP